MPQPAVVSNVNTAELLSLSSDVALLNSPGLSAGSRQTSTQNDTQTTKPKITHPLLLRPLQKRGQWQLTP